MPFLVFSVRGLLVLAGRVIIPKDSPACQLEAQHVRKYERGCHHPASWSARSMRERERDLNQPASSLLVVAVGLSRGEETNNAFFFGVGWMNGCRHPCNLV